MTETTKLAESMREGETHVVDGSYINKPKIQIIPDPMATELRLFKAEDRYEIKGRGTIWTGPCPFRWDKAEGLVAWDGQWIIAHPDADHTKTLKVVAVESFCLQVIRQGSSVGIVVKEAA